MGILEEDILDYPIQAVSTGTPKLIIPVDSLETLFKIKPDLSGIKKYCQKHSAKGFYPFTFAQKRTILVQSKYIARPQKPQILI